MNDEVLYSLGVDLNRNGSFHDGDIQLVSYEDNLVQAVVNRLNTNLDELDLFYENYGSVLQSFLGWRATDETLRFVESELENVLKAEPRLSSWDFNVTYNKNGVLQIELKLFVTSDLEVEVDLIVNENGVEVIE